MIAADFRNGGLHVRLLNEMGDCYIQAVDSATGNIQQSPKTLCHSLNLNFVLNGMRYHVAGGNCVYSIYRDGNHVVFECEAGENAIRSCRVPASEYEEALKHLAGVPTSHGYAA
jgi:hypothetical protein